MKNPLHINFRNLKYPLRYISECIIPPQNTDTEKNIFIHIPKTAGNSFITAIYDHVPQHHVYPNYIDKTIVNKGHYIKNQELLDQKDQLLRDKNWLIGHFSYPFSKRIWPDAKIYTFFRSPVDRIISHTYHLMEKDPRYAGQTFDEIIENRGSIIAGQQARMMGYIPKKKNIDEVKERIRNLHYIGITEKFEQSLELLANITGWKKLKPVKKNIGKYQKHELSPKIKSSIRELDFLDHEIYQTALEEFDKRIKAAK